MAILTNKAETRKKLSERMLEMLREDRQAFIHVLVNYVEDIGMGIAMDEGKQDRETVSQMEFHEFMDKLLEEE